MAATISVPPAPTWRRHEPTSDVSDQLPSLKRRDDDNGASEDNGSAQLPANIRPAELDVICGNPLRVIPLLESVMQNGVGALKTKARGRVNYAGVLELVQLVCKRHESDHGVAHAALDALDTFIDSCPPHAVAAPLEELVFDLLAVHRDNGSVVAHVFDKFAVMSVTERPCYGILLAMKMLQPANVDVVAHCIRLMRQSRDKGGLEAIFNCVQTLVVGASVPWKRGLVSSNVFSELGSLLDDDDEDLVVLLPMAKRFLVLARQLSERNEQVLREILELRYHLPMLKLMSRLGDDDDVQLLGCQLLHVFSSTSVGRRLINCSEAYDCIVHCLCDYVDRATILVVALRFLINMSTTEACCRLIICTGIVPHVVQCLYRSDVVALESLYHCCTLLINLSSDRGWISAALYKADVHLALRHLLVSARRFPVQLLTHACCVLVNLTSSFATFVGDGGFALIDANIHNFLIDAVVAHSAVVDKDGRKGAHLAMHACWVVANLSQLDEVRHVLVDDRFVSRLVGVVALYSTDPRVFSKALQALAAVAASADDKAVLGGTRVPRAIVQLLATRQPLLAHLARLLFGVFANMAFRCNANKRRLTDYGAHQQIIRYMLVYRDDAALQVAGCRALFSIGINDKSKKIMLERLALETIQRLMTTHRRHVEAQKQGLLVLAALALVDMESRRILVDFGFLVNVQATLVQMPLVVDVQTLGIIVLLRLARNECNLKRIAEIGAVRLTEQAMRQFPNEVDIQNCGATLLNNLCCGVVAKKQLGLSHKKAKVNRSDALVVQRFAGFSHHACPNCRTDDGGGGGSGASELIVTINPLPVNVFQDLVERGWFRRGGIHLFLYASSHASACDTVELRVRIDAFDAASRSSYGRVTKKCAKKCVTVRTIRPRFTAESFDLYRRYQTERHDAEHVTPESFRAHVVDSPLTPVTKDGVEYGTFHQEYRIGDRLVGVGVIDVLPRAVCSVYMYYDPSPDVAKLSLGVFSTLKEIEFAAALNGKGASISHYYLGNFNPNNAKLLYKASYQPAEVFCAYAQGGWLPYDASESDSILFKKNCLSVIKPPPPPSPLLLMSFLNDIRFRLEDKCWDYQGLVSQYVVNCQNRVQDALAALVGAVGPKIAARLTIDVEVIGADSH